MYFHSTIDRDSCGSAPMASLVSFTLGKKDDFITDWLDLNRLNRTI